MSEKRSPWLKWYPADWRADPRLRMCSLAARGLWIELIGYMHEAPLYGHLLIGDSAPSVKQIAMLVGESPAVVQRCVDELSEAGVYSITDDDIIYSRRMVRDKAKAEADRARGKQGGNPNLLPPLNGGVNPPHNGHDKAGDKDARGHAPATQKPDTRSSSEGSIEPSAADPEKPVYDLGKIVLGAKAGGFVKKLLVHVGGDCERAIAALDRARKKSDPREYVGAFIRGERLARTDDVLAETDALYRRLGVDL